jgi:hypothetical protein
LAPQLLFALNSNTEIPKARKQAAAAADKATGPHGGASQAAGFGGGLITGVYCLPSTTVCPQLLFALNYCLPSA